MSTPGGLAVRFINEKKLSLITKIVLGCAAAALAVACLAIRLPVLLGDGGNTLTTWAAGMALPNGAKAALENGYGDENPEKPPDDVSALAPAAESSSDEKEDELSSSSSSEGTASSATKSEPIPPDPNNRIKIREVQFGASGEKYANFYLKNNAGAAINVPELLLRRPDIHVKKNGEPQVLIMHTHTCESYMTEDLGYYPADFYPRTTDNQYNVTRVGNAIAEKLTAAGIGVVHDMTVHDNPSYNGSYTRSEATIQKNLQQYPSIQVVLDIHRDALGNEESGKTKPVFVVDGKKAAQIMIVSGYNNSANKFPDWQYNMSFALKLQQAAENRYPGMTRPLNFTSMQYNMYLTHGSLLIEVGTDANTLDEAVYSGSLLGDVLVDVLNDLTE